MRLMAAIALAAATLIGNPQAAAAGDEPIYDSELLAAYCIGVFGADQTSLASFVVPSCLTDEAANDCSARIADIDLERHRVDRTLRRLQDSLAARGIVTPQRYLALAKYLVATSCWDGL